MKYPSQPGRGKPREGEMLKKDRQGFSSLPAKKEYF